MRRLIVVTTVLLCLAGCEGRGTNPSDAPAAKKSEGLVTVSLTFDDTVANQWDGVGIMHRYDMLGTFYVNSPRIDDGIHLTKAQLDEMQTRGHEIGGHTLNHCKCIENEPDIDIVRREICDDHDALVKKGYTVTSFAYPRGEAGGHMTPVAKECYASAREVGGIAGGSPNTAESIPPCDVFAIRTPRSVNVGDSLEDLQGYIIAARESGGGWVPLIFHHVSDDERQDLRVTPELFDKFLQWLSAERAAGRVVIKTVSGTLKN
ncbi:MAG: polysaccharide deacetylase family protein [Pirellulales bacterium]